MFDCIRKRVVCGWKHCYTFRTTQHIQLNVGVTETGSGRDTFQEIARIPDENHEELKRSPTHCREAILSITILYCDYFCIALSKNMIKGRQNEKDVQDISKKFKRSFSHDKQPGNRKSASPRLRQPTERNRPGQVTRTYLSNNASKIYRFHTAMPTIILPALSAFPLSGFPNCHPKCSSNSSA